MGDWIKHRLVEIIRFWKSAKLIPSNTDFGTYSDKSVEDARSSNERDENYENKLLQELEQNELKELLNRVKIEINLGKEKLATVEVEKSDQISQTIPKGKLSHSVGATLPEFLKRLTEEISRKKTEWLIVGLFEELIPKYMIEVKGRSSWLFYNANHIIEEIKKTGIKRIVTLHNHPASSILGPSLNPSEEDLKSSYAFYLQCQKEGINLMEDFIISGGYCMPYLTQRLIRAGVLEKISIEGVDELLWSYLEKGKLYHFTVLKSVFLNLKHGNVIEGKATIPDGVLEKLEKIQIEETEKKKFISKVILSYSINRMTGITHSQVRDILKDLEKDGLHLRTEDWVRSFLSKPEVDF